MAYDFPNTPTIGDHVTTPGGAVLAWDGVKWSAQAPSAQFVAKTGDTMTGLLTLSGDPTAALGASTRQYVDNKTWTYAALPGQVQQLSFNFTFQGRPAASARLNIPVAAPVSIAATLTGSVVFDSTLATAAAVFTLNRISGASQTALGTLTVTPTSNTSVTLAGAGGLLAAGDDLQLVAPASQDTTLADIGITILAQRT